MHCLTCDYNCFEMTRTSEEPAASSHQHTGSSLHTLPVRMQGSKPVEDQQDRVAVQKGRRPRHRQLSPNLPVVCRL